MKVGGSILWMTGLFILSCAWISPVSAQTKKPETSAQKTVNERPKPVYDITLHLKATLLSDNSVNIGYEVPYPGLIEFHLYKDGKKIWNTAIVREKGEYFMTLNRAKLDATGEYTYDFFYKGKKYPGKFINS